MYDMKKTENGWELWFQLGNPTEHLVATVEKEPVARKLMGILADQDDTPPKTAYVEMVGDFNLDDPEYAEYRVCLLYTSPSPRDSTSSRMPSSA